MPRWPTMWPRNLSGVGTVAEAGRWSTSSVEMRGSDNSCLIFAVYSASCFWAACANAAGTMTTCDSAPAANSAILHRRIEPVERDILSPSEWRDSGGNALGRLGQTWSLLILDGAQRLREGRHGRCPWRVYHQSPTGCPTCTSPQFGGHHVAALRNS